VWCEIVLHNLAETVSGEHDPIVHKHQNRFNTTNPLPILGGGPAKVCRPDKTQPGRGPVRQKKNILKKKYIYI
jgi:hypothetical protein